MRWRAWAAARYSITHTAVGTNEQEEPTIQAVCYGSSAAATAAKPKAAPFTSSTSKVNNDTFTQDESWHKIHFSGRDKHEKQGTAPSLPSPPSLPCQQHIKKTRTHASTQPTHTRDPPQHEKYHVGEEPPVVTRAHAVPDPRAVVVERPHAPPAVPAVPRPQRPLDRARVAGRAGHGARAALQPHEARRGVLDVVEVAVVVGRVAAVPAPHKAGGALPLLAREDTHSAVERRGHLGVRGVHEPEAAKKGSCTKRGGGDTRWERGCLLCSVLSRENRAALNHFTRHENVVGTSFDHSAPGQITWEVSARIRARK